MRIVQCPPRRGSQGRFGTVEMHRKVHLRAHQPTAVCGTLTRMTVMFRPANPGSGSPVATGAGGNGAERAISRGVHHELGTPPSGRREGHGGSGPVVSRVEYAHAGRAHGRRVHLLE